MIKRLLIIYSAALLFAVSCKVDPKIIPVLPTNNLVEIIPEGFPKPVYTFSNNPISQNTFILGRALFYEPMLSKNNQVSCSSCHQYRVAFANQDHQFSHGVIDSLVGTRNAPALFNLTWMPAFMHDGGIPNIEQQPLAPLQNTVEMGENIVEVVAKLQASAKFQALFKNAYGSDEVSSQKMFRSIAQFMALLYSYNSKYDYYKRKENNVTFSDAELKGYNLFLLKCNSCHKEPLFTDYQYRNNGLKVDPNLNDLGRARITQLDEDKYKFKTPSLRNIALTGPYMHDGTLTTLEQCLDHYTNGINNFTNLDPSLVTGLQISSEEKQDIISFLQTLTDYELISDQRFQDPNSK